MATMGNLAAPGVPAAIDLRYFGKETPVLSVKSYLFSFIASGP